MNMIAGCFAPLRTHLQRELFARMPEHVRRLGWSATEIAAHQRAELGTLLATAAERSPFHARRLRGIDPTRFEVADLPRLPIMTKAELMAEFDDVLTDRRLSRGLVEETLARTREEPIPIFDEFVCQTSGGSSGVRGVFVLDSRAMVEFPSALMRPTMARLMGGGATPPDGLTFAMVGAASAVHATGIAPKFFEGSPIRWVSAPATLPLAEVVARLNEVRPHALFGYASMLARLAVERREGRLRIEPTVVRSTSETLLPEHRDVIRSAFGVPLFDNYGSSEGLVGISGPDEPVMTFASDLCIVELVDEANRPIPAGVPSAKILVTNLFNHAQPLIRYVIEDTFVGQPDSPSHGHLRATVQGRSDDVLHYDGRDIHPLVIRAVMVKTPEVSEYQVRQRHTGIDISCVADRTLDGEGLGERLRAALATAGLENPTVTVRIVAALDRQPGTGKLRRFIPL